MARKSILIKNEVRMSREEAAAFLRQLADKLESGQVHMVQGNREVALNVPAQVVLEVQVDDKPKPRKGTKRSLEVEIEWYTGTDGEPPASLELK
jgi:amphi-Trp domain-containing protein